MARVDSWSPFRRWRRSRLALWWHATPIPAWSTGYFVSGGGTLMVKGQPDREVKAGDSYLVPADTPHEFKNGAMPAKLLVTYVVDKDKPLTSPAPA